MIDDIREWISDNLRYILLGLAAIVIIIIIVVVVRLVTRSSDHDNSDAGSKGTVQQVDDGDEVSGDDDEDSGEDENVVSTEGQDFEDESTASNLIKDDAEVLTLVREYYTARSAKDITTLSQIMTPWDSATQSNLLQNDLVESYNEISTYSEPGLNDGSYVVFTCFKAKIPDFETLVPSLRMLYLVTEEGELKVLADYESDPEIASFVNNIAKDADVQQLLARVNAEYDQALNSDAELKAYLTDLEAVASEGEEEENQNGENGAGEVRTALYALNIRETASTEANILGGVPANSEVTVLQDVEDGWTQISFDPGTGAVIGYVRTEYLG